MTTEFWIAALTVAGTIVATIITLRSQTRRDVSATDMDSRRLYEEIRQSLMAELHQELQRERLLRAELEARIDALEMENRALEESRLVMSQRIEALEHENEALRQRRLRR